MVTVAFITCVNDQSIYQQCLAHLALLNKDGFSVEYIPVQDNESITRAYNRAMMSTQAQYKIYLHQDAFIVDPLFLHHIRNIFLSDPGIGMIGMLGGRRMPCGDEKLLCWTECQEIYGGCYLPKAKAGVRGTVTNNPYEWVTVVDGFIIATQYDLPWREDIIDGFHFYDKSQSLEFWKRDLKVVVPVMKDFWAHHLCNSWYSPEYHRLRGKFLQAYRQYLSEDMKNKTMMMRHMGKKYRYKVK